MTEEAGKLTRWRLQLSAFDFQVVHLAGVKLQATELLSHLPTTRIDVSPLVDNIPGLMIIEAQPEGGKSKTDKKNWHSFPSNDAIDTEKPALSEVL